MKDIKDYLHLYLGCEFRWQWEVSTEIKQRVLDTELLGEFYFHNPPYKQWLILRPLSDMSKKENKELSNIIGLETDNEIHIWTPEQFMWLLSKHFDLFGLIKSGLAINKTKINNHE